MPSIVAGGYVMDKFVVWEEKSDIISYVFTGCPERWNFEFGIEISERDVEKRIEKGWLEYLKGLKGYMEREGYSYSHDSFSKAREAYGERIVEEGNALERQVKYLSLKLRRKKKTRKLKDKKLINKYKHMLLYTRKKLFLYKRPDGEYDNEIRKQKAAAIFSLFSLNCEHDSEMIRKIESNTFLYNFIFEDLGHQYKEGEKKQLKNQKTLKKDFYRCLYMSGLFLENKEKYSCKGKKKHSSKAEENYIFPVEKMCDSGGVKSLESVRHKMEKEYLEINDRYLLEYFRGFSMAYGGIRLYRENDEKSAEIFLMEGIGEIISYVSGISFPYIRKRIFDMTCDRLKKAIIENVREKGVLDHNEKSIIYNKVMDLDISFINLELHIIMREFFSYLYFRYFRDIFKADQELAFNKMYSGFKILCESDEEEELLQIGSFLCDDISKKEKQYFKRWIDIASQRMVNQSRKNILH